MWMFYSISLNHPPDVFTFYNVGVKCLTTRQSHSLKNSIGTEAQKEQQHVQTDVAATAAGNNQIR